MIRINLLGVPRPKKGKRASAAAAASMPGEGPNALLLIVIGLVIGLGAFLFLYYGATNQRDNIAKKLDEANKEGTRLVAVKTKYVERKKEAEAFEKRVNVIDQLHNEQQGPVTLLATIGNQVNNTDAVWLDNMSETGNSVNIDGMALSTSAVANLMTNLKRSGYFKSVEIKDATQDPTNKDMQAFKFTLICEKQPKS